MKRIIFLFLIVILLTACAPAGEVPSSSVQAWVDQPVTGTVLPVGTFTIKTHARHAGAESAESSFVTVCVSQEVSQAGFAADGSCGSFEKIPPIFNTKAARSVGTTLPPALRLAIPPMS